MNEIIKTMILVLQRQEKTIFLTILATLVGILITLLTYSGKVDWFFFILGIILTSFLFTLYGFLAALSLVQLSINTSSR